MRRGPVNGDVFLLLQVELVFDVVITSDQEEAVTAVQETTSTEEARAALVTSIDAAVSQAPTLADLPPPPEGTSRVAVAAPEVVALIDPEPTAPPKAEETLPEDESSNLVVEEEKEEKGENTFLGLSQNVSAGLGAVIVGVVAVAAGYGIWKWKAAKRRGNERMREYIAEETDGV